MEQAKKRDHKIDITDIAIRKIPPYNCQEYFEEQLEKINRKHTELLQKAKDCNCSNETAVLFDLLSDEEAWMFGNEHEVNIFQNPVAVSMANQRERLFLTHNHPSTQIFSYSDLGVFLMNDNIIGFSVITNTGDLHVLTKNKSYSFKRAYELLFSVRRAYGVINEEINIKIVKEFLRVARSAGIIYN